MQQIYQQIDHRILLDYAKAELRLISPPVPPSQDPVSADPSGEIRRAGDGVMEKTGL